MEATDIIDKNSEDYARKDMNGMYRWTRHVYDMSRKYYLLGRDYLIEHLKPQAGQTVCEIGCGTARNLIKLAEKYPDAKFYGLDASDEMLKTARNNIKGANLDQKIVLKQGFSQSFEPKVLFDLETDIDKIVFSYALSIIPPWKESLEHACSKMAPDGEMHIVDFGSQEGLPKTFRHVLFWFLDKFHVYHKPEILEHLREMEQEGKGALVVKDLYKGYAYHAIFKKIQK
ncbi:MAG: class I SAM-dependent methyltransferase [Alphaproteobacteria bacterium]|nr:class I SAM-dependent methyltransferase [Alphaproteobacteria bacterium]